MMKSQYLLWNHIKIMWTYCNR